MIKRGEAYIDGVDFRERLVRGWTERPSLTSEDKLRIEVYLSKGNPSVLPLQYKVLRKGMREHGIGIAHVER